MLTKLSLSLVFRISFRSLFTCCSPRRWRWNDVPAQRAGQAAGHRGVQHPGHGRMRHRPAAAQRRLLRSV